MIFNYCNSTMLSNDTCLIVTNVLSYYRSSEVIWCETKTMRYQDFYIINVNYLFVNNIKHCSWLFDVQAKKPLWAS